MGQGEAAHEGVRFRRRPQLRKRANLLLKPGEFRRESHRSHPFVSRLRVSNEMHMIDAAQHDEFFGAWNAIEHIANAIGWNRDVVISGDDERWYRTFPCKIECCRDDARTRITRARRRQTHD